MRVDALAISTLRGQFADNREWSAHPSRPAVIDMMVPLGVSQESTGHVEIRASS